MAKSFMIILHQKHTEIKRKSFTVPSQYAACKKQLIKYDVLFDSPKLIFL